MMKLVFVVVWPPRSCEVDESKMSLPGRSKQAKEEEEEEEGRR